MAEALGHLWQQGPVDLLEYAPSGTFFTPPGMFVTEDHRFGALVDDAPWLREAERSTILPVNEWIYAAISAPSGLTRGEAAILLAGFRNANLYEADFLGPEIREILGVKTAEVRPFRELMRGIKLPERVVLLESAMRSLPVTERLIGEETVAGALGATWARLRGKKAVVPPALLTRPWDLGGDAAGTLAEFLDPAHGPLATDGATGINTEAGIVEVLGGFSSATLTRILPAMLWVYHHTSPGDEARAAIPAVQRALQDRLRSPGLLLEVSRGWMSEPARKLYEGFSGKLIGEGVKDGGSMLVANVANQALIAVRPQLLLARGAQQNGHTLEEATAFAAVAFGRASTVLRQLAFVFGAALDRIVADSQLPGGWRQDPRQSAPEVVAAAMARLGLPEDAATLYLQLLSLYDPTRKNSLEWNAWSAKTYDAAAALLVRQDLVVEGKRARAGSAHFLPGGWDDRKGGALPLEEWKHSLFGGPTPPFGPFFAVVPYPELFAQAWRRVEDGDLPKYERQSDAR